MTACFLIYATKQFYKQRLFLIGGFALLLTFLEWIAVKLGYVEYGQGWNMFWTLISYLIALQLIYLYYLLVEKKVVKL
jgi:hypothetical protein